MNPLMMKVMNPLSRGYPRRYDRQPLDQGLRRPSKISQISSNDEAFDEGFDEPSSSSWRAWTPPQPTSCKLNIRLQGLLRHQPPPVNTWPRANRIRTRDRVQRRPPCLLCSPATDSSSRWPRPGNCSVFPAPSPTSWPLGGSFRPSVSDGGWWSRKWRFSPWSGSPIRILELSTPKLGDVRLAASLPRTLQP